MKRFHQLQIALALAGVRRPSLNASQNKPVLLIGLLMLLLAMQEQQPLATILLLVFGSVLTGTGGYLWYQDRQKAKVPVGSWRGTTATIPQIIKSKS